MPEFFEAWLRTLSLEQATELQEWFSDNGGMHIGSDEAVHVLCILEERIKEG